MSNVSGTEVTGDYFWAKAIGIRGSLVDRGITFGTNTRRGACLKFHKPVAVLGVRLHPGATLTLVDVEGFLEAVERRRIQSRGRGGGLSGPTGRRIRKPDRFPASP